MNLITLRPPTHIIQKVRHLIGLPAPMRPAYLKAALDYLSPRISLCKTLKRVVSSAGDEEIRRVVESALADETIWRIKETRPHTTGTLSDNELVLLHCLVLLIKPDIIVETGVAHGSSSAALLSALHKNGKGALYSIDLPTVEINGKVQAMFKGYSFRLEDVSVVPGYDQVGWLVPEFLKDRWHLQLGDSLTVLPDTLKCIGNIDMFIHDSLHWYSHMRSEFELVWPYLKAHGVLLSDDIFLLRHSAISDFAASVKTEFTNFFGMGIICKS